MFLQFPCVRFLRPTGLCLHLKNCSRFCCYFTIAVASKLAHHYSLLLLAAASMLSAPGHALARRTRGNQSHPSAASIIRLTVRADPVLLFTAHTGRTLCKRSTLAVRWKTDQVGLFDISGLQCLCWQRWCLDSTSVNVLRNLVRAIYHSVVIYSWDIN